MTDALAQPYPERITELERELSKMTDKFEEAWRLFMATRQQYYDADHALRIRDTECRRLRSEASDLMADNAGLIQVNDQLKRDKAELHERLDRQGETFGKLLRIGRQQGERIRELEAEVERIKGADMDAARALVAAWTPDEGQYDLPPTRAESDAMASLADTLAGIDNEEREG